MNYYFTTEDLNSPIGTTPNHPFWSEDKQQFVRADELKPGETLRNANGTLTHVQQVFTRPGTSDVFNLEVQVKHTYHVAANGVLVHNGADDCVTWLSPKTLKFSQRNVNENVVGYIHKMELSDWKWRTMGGTKDNDLRVLRLDDGTLVSLDNRRLLASRLTGQKEIPVRIVDWDAPKIPGAKKTNRKDLFDKLDGAIPTFDLPGILF